MFQKNLITQAKWESKKDALKDDGSFKRIKI